MLTITPSSVKEGNCPTCGRPTNEEARIGFADLERYPIACWVVASDFAPPVYYCGGFEDSVARVYLETYLRRNIAETVMDLASTHHRRRFFQVDVRHEMRKGWKTVRLCAGLQLCVSVEVDGTEGRRRSSRHDPGPGQPREPLRHG